MKDRQPNLVVLTPVRNEAWILPRFLTVTAKLADAIIVLDQNSTDGSVEICQAHPKVHLLRNPSSRYDEAERQRILIDAARKLVPMPRVLLALDADEIIAADAAATHDWQRGMSAEPGTVLRIEKPTFFPDFNHVLRYPDGFPLAFVDDNSLHEANLIHSDRVPSRPSSPKIFLEDVKILHYALLRPKAQRAKNRMYSAVENINRSRHAFSRREFYGQAKDYSLDGPMTATNPQWMAGWEEAGIDMRSVPDESPHWQDFEMLRLMAEHGAQRFWLDDVWDMDWEACRKTALGRGIQSVPRKPIHAPPALLQWMMKGPDAAYRAIRAVRSGRKQSQKSMPVQANAELGTA